MKQPTDTGKWSSELDQNPFPQLRKPFGKAVRSPEDIEDCHEII